MTLESISIHCADHALSDCNRAPGAYFKVRFTFQMLRLFEISFCAVWDILENKWQL